MKDWAEDFVQSHQNRSTACVRLEYQPFYRNGEISIFSVDHVCHKISLNCNCNYRHMPFSEKQVEFILRSAENNWQLLRCLLISGQHLSDKQLNHALRLAGKDWEILKFLMHGYAKQLSGRQFNQVLKLAGKEWQQLEACGFKSFSEEQLEKIINTFDNDSAVTKAIMAHYFILFPHKRLPGRIVKHNNGRARFGISFES